jgi:hypothetical protein
MSRPQPPAPAKLVVGLLLQRIHSILPVVHDLQAAFGSIDMISPWFPFGYTDYYAPEMGAPLFRRVIVFKRLAEQGLLADIKLATNAIELKYTQNGKRTVNIDPGLLLQERFVLATGKNYSHRIYIGNGIYADLTLIYRNGAYRVLDWTYPDYAAEGLRDYLLAIRRKYVQDLKRTFEP